MAGSFLPILKLSPFIGKNSKRMMMNRYLQTGLYGIIAWLIPFLIAIPLYSPDGTLLIDEQLFKTIMIITGGVVGAYLIVRLFQNITMQHIREGCIIGGIWLLINWILDLLILVPLNGMSVSEYFMSIGLRYLMMPVMSIMGGYIAENAGKNRRGEGS